jgi:hypothetical protein
VYPPGNQSAKRGSAHFDSLKIVCSAFRRRCSPRTLFDAEIASNDVISHALSYARPSMLHNIGPL